MNEWAQVALKNAFDPEWAKQNKMALFVVWN